jgi:glutaredoxin
MKRTHLFALAVALACGPLGAAQLYRWVDEKGHVEWRDTPPPPNAKQVEQRSVGSNTIQTSTLPYSVQQAVRNFPVTLWVYDCGETCTEARNHLARRGVPYTERNGRTEAEALKKLTGSYGVPVLYVGTTKLSGYLDTAWDSALDTAGYPKTAPPGVKPQVQQASKPAPDPAAKAPAAGQQPAANAQAPAPAR